MSDIPYKPSAHLHEVPKAEPFSWSEWWLAMLFSFLLPGVGHLYLGYLRLGIILVGFIPLYTMIHFVGNEWMVAFFVVFGILVRIISLVSLCFIRTKPAEENFRRATWQQCLVLIVIFGVISLSPKPEGNVRSFSVPSTTMEPTILRGDTILADMTFYENQPIQRGDIVVFRPPINHGEFWIKRIVGLPGEDIMVNETGVFINEQKVIQTNIEGSQPFMHIWSSRVGGPENYKYGHESQCQWEKHDHVQYVICLEGKYVETFRNKFELGQDMFFVMGDLRNNSQDSRYYGPIDREDILGKVTFIMKSRNYNRIGPFKEITKESL